MNPLAISIGVFACLFGSALIGMRLRSVIPEHFLSDDSKHVLEASLGIIGTMAGLVLGLLVASAFGTYNAQRNELIDLSSKAVLLDRVLAHYGPAANASRAELRADVTGMLDRLWPAGARQASGLQPSVNREALFDEVVNLSPTDDAQRSIKGEAVGLVIALGEMRWLMFEQLTIGFSVAMMVVLVFWFMVTFAALGMLSRPSPIPVIALCLCAIAVSAAIFIIQEMYTPFSGALQISSAPLREALTHLGQ
jgi:predicted outer membrane lipoprotein